MSCATSDIIPLFNSLKVVSTVGRINRNIAKRHFNADQWTRKRKAWFSFIVFNATFNTISVISWWSVSLVEETGGSGENHRPVASHWQTLSHTVVHLALIEIRTHNIGGDRRWLQIKGVVNPTTIRSRSRRPPVKKNYDICW